MKSLEEHLADFILNNCRGELYREYRRQNLELWERVYGQDFALRVKSMIEKRWKNETREKHKNA